MAQGMQFPHLYTPIKVGGVTLKNRIVAAPSSQNDVEHNGTLSLHNIAYFARKAKGGAALVTVGDGIVHPSGQNHPHQLLFTDDCLPCLVRAAEEVHKYGGLISIELSHGGIVCDPAYNGCERPYGPSEVPVTIGFQTNHPVNIMSKEMTVEFMEELAEAYGEAAARVKKAGFDMLMIHGSHGWLISQFFSPATNKRTDEFGGSVENRARFAVMVLKKVREKVGPRFPIDFRINGRDGMEGGLELEDSIEICKILEPYVSSFHVSSCFHMIPSHQDIMQSTIFMPRGHLLDYAIEIKKHVNVPVCTVGGMHDLAVMEKLIAEGKVDLIALGRQSLADPDIANKGRRGLYETVRPCQRCATCQSGRFSLGTARCAVNPEIGREYEVQFIPPAEKKYKIFVAGGGPGGMQAAITAAKRGHTVTLFEKSGKLGGALNFAETVSFKRDLFALIGAMASELKTLPVEIRMNTALTPEIAEAEKPDVIISAIGADAIRPPFPGIDRDNVKMAEDVHGGAPVGERVVVIGGGLVGIECALELAAEGKKVSVVEMLPDVANDANFRYFRTYHWELERKGVDIYTSAKCREITDAGVVVERADGETAVIPADTVVISVGMRPREAESEALRFCAPEFIPIGNCVAAGQIKNAIRAGYDAAMFLE